MEKSEWIRFRSDPELKTLLEEVANERNQPASQLARQILRSGLNEVVSSETEPRQISILDSAGDQRDAF